jgi:hypothetical protein
MKRKRSDDIEKKNALPVTELLAVEIPEYKAHRLSE